MTVPSPACFPLASALSGNTGVNISAAVLLGSAGLNPGVDATLGVLSILSMNNWRGLAEAAVLRILAGVQARTIRRKDLESSHYSNILWSTLCASAWSEFLHCTQSCVAVRVKQFLCTCSSFPTTLCHNDAGTRNNHID